MDKYELRLILLACAAVLVTAALIFGLGLVSPTFTDLNQPRETLLIASNATLLATCPTDGTPPCWYISLYAANYGNVVTILSQIQLNGTSYIPTNDWPITYQLSESSKQGVVVASPISVQVKVGQNFSTQFYLDSSGAAVGGEKFTSGQQVVINLLTSDGDSFPCEFTLP